MIPMIAPQNHHLTILQNKMIHQQQLIVIKQINQALKQEKQLKRKIQKQTLQLHQMENVYLQQRFFVIGTVKESIKLKNGMTRNFSVSVIWI